MKSLRHILLVEQNPSDAQRTLRTLAEYNLANQVDVVSDGSEAVQYLLRQGVYHLRSSGLPALIFIDFRSLNGEAPAPMDFLSADGRFRNIPVVIMVSSREERSSIEKEGSKNTTYVVKPIDVHDVLEAMKSLGGAWAVVPEPSKESAVDKGGVTRRFHNEPQPGTMTKLYHGTNDPNPASRG